MFRFSPFLSQGDGVKNATKINPFEQFITKQLRPEKTPTRCQLYSIVQSSTIL